MGLTWDTPRSQARKDDAPEPRRLWRMPRRRANSTMSWTTRKYGPKPRWSAAGGPRRGPRAPLPGQVRRRREALRDDLPEAPREEVGRKTGDDAVEGELALLGDLGGPGQ